MQWPDWKGETALIVGTGPSAKAAQLHLAQGHARVFVIKSTWRLAPWADALYGIDFGWWMANDGAGEFRGLKFSPSPLACRTYPDIVQTRLKDRAEILTKEKGMIGCGLRTGGGHSGFQAINLAVQFGAKRILLVGFDMTFTSRDDEAGVAKPNAGRIEEWREAFDGCAPQFAALGIDVVNCTMASALKSYPKLPLHEALQ